MGWVGLVCNLFSVGLPFIQLQFRNYVEASHICVQFSNIAEVLLKGERGRPNA